MPNNIPWSPIPDVPLEGLNAAESGLFRAMKENLELAAGVRIPGIYALGSPNVTVAVQDVQQMKHVSAGANGYAVSYPNGASLAAATGAIVIISATDYANLISDVQGVANDVARLQNVVNSLIAQLQK